jgi:sugar phosphate permease
MAGTFATLTLAYVLSQFYRACLAVLAPVLEADIGATAEDLALASGIWFAVFAAMQIPVGWALDRVGPRRTAGWLMGLAAAGAAVFGTAQGPGAIVLAMALIGAGCAPVLMAAFYIFARSFRPAVFASLAGGLIGVGSAGNLASAAPLAWAIGAFGWRASLWMLAAVTLAVALAVLSLLRDPPSAPREAHGRGIGLGAVLRQPALWLLVPLALVNYAPAAGTRGLWAGPYMADVFGLDAGGIGLVTLGMALAMIAGNFAYGPADRIFGTRKWVVLAGNLAAAACLIGLWAAPAAGVGQAALLLAGLGFFGSSFAQLMGHGRAYFPPHLVGRGVSLLNLLSIGGVGLLQIASGRLHAASTASAAPPAETYGGLFLFFAALMLAGCAVYAFSRDRLD